MPPESTKSAEPRGLSYRAAYACIRLRHVPWKVYEAMRSVEGNRHVRMTYLDGVLLVMSPEYLHDLVSHRLRLIIQMVALGWGVEVAGTGTTTLRRQGDGRRKGSGKEPDIGFYVGPNERLIRGKRSIDLDIDPPPDLAVEVNNKSDSKFALPIYSRLGVPEVWRLDARKGSLWFGRLSDGEYDSINRSVCLPWLTPSLVLEALGMIEDGQMSETPWLRWLIDWARQLPEPPPPG